jgi:hypothetical protein
VGRGSKLCELYLGTSPDQNARWRKYESYERRTGIGPDLHRRKIFGCRAISHVPRKKRGTLDDRARFGIFVVIEGYDTYRIFYPETKDVEFVRNVRFDETVFPGEEGGSSLDGGRDDPDDDYADLPGLADTESESEDEPSEPEGDSEDELEDPTDESNDDGIEVDGDDEEELEEEESLASKRPLRQRRPP